MSDKKLPWWVSGPPGTGKTRGFIKRKYKKFISEGIDWNRIVVLSHTVNAAKEILKAVKEIPEMKKIPDDALEEQICTIHSYFHGEGKKRKVFGSKDHRSFCKENHDVAVFFQLTFFAIRYCLYPAMDFFFATPTNMIYPSMQCLTLVLQ